MDVEKLKETTEEELAPVAEKKHRRPDLNKVAFWTGAALIVLIAVIVCVVLIRAWNYSALKRENKDLKSSASEMEDQLAVLEETQAQLTASEQKVRLLEESTNALKEQVDGLNAEKEDLNNKLEELLNVQQTAPVITRDALAEKISALSELVTKKYWYRNATQKEDAKKWLWGADVPFSNREFVALYDGSITAGIDLKKVKFDVDETAGTITVTVPKSEIFDHNIPQETINVVVAKDGLFNPIDFNDYNRFISGEKEVMEDTAIGKGLLKEADEEAREILEAFLKTIPGIDRYKIVFK